jgi:outer membrane receptor for ferrienterochelin and colicins
VDFLFNSLVRSQDIYYGISLNGSYQLREEDVLAFGTDLNWNILKITSSLPSSKSLRTQAPYVNYTYTMDRWDIIPGLRYDHNERFGSQTSPSMGLVYHFENSLQTAWRSKVSRAFNAPPLLWVYQTSGSTLPNPDLQAEKSYVYETGMETKLTQNIGMDLNLYYSQIKDAISTIDVLGKSQKVNVDRFDNRGIESLWKYQMLEGLVLYGGGGFNDVRDKATNDIVRDQGIARVNYKMGLDYQHKNGFGFHLTGMYNRWSSSPDLEPNDRKMIWDMKVTKKFSAKRVITNWETFLSIHNLTNSKYWSSSTFPLPERYFEGGFSLDF